MGMGMGMRVRGGFDRRWEVGGCWVWEVFFLFLFKL